MARNPSPPRRRFGLERILARLGGADARILDKAQVDTAEMRGRGIAALIPAIFGALAATVAFRYAYTLPLAAAAAVGTGWGLVVICFDLSLMSVASGKGRGASLAVALGGRALVSLLAAFTFASPIAIAIFAKDIATRIATDQQNGLATYNRTVIIPAYSKKITSDQQIISKDQNHINSAEQTVAYWQRQVENATVQATCEAQGVSGLAGCQAGSGEQGQGSIYSVRVAELQNDETNLSTAKTQAQAISATLGPQITAAQRDLASQQKQEQSDYAAAQASYLADDGLIARWRALGELEAANSSVRIRVWLLEGLIVAIDLSAVTSRLTSRTPSYDAQVAAERKVLEVEADLACETATARVLRERASLRTKTDIHNERLSAQFTAAKMREITRLAVAKWRAEKWANDQMSGDEFYASRHGGRPGLSILTQAPADWGPLPAPPPPDSELRPAWELAALARELSMAIASYRALDGLSRRDLADLLGWKSRQVSNLETAERNPSMAALAQLICRLGLKMHIELAPKQGIPYPDIQLKVTKVPPALPPAN